MILKVYTLDLSGQSGVPSQWGILLPQVVALMSKQLKGMEGVQLVADRRRRGTFEITAYTQEAINYLSGFKLKIAKENREFEIPLMEKSSKKAVWVTMNGTTWGKLATLPNSYFDGVLKESGVSAIKVETKRRYHRGTKVYNGQREALVELGDAPIERQHFWTDEEGKDHGWWLTYRGQPFSCRRCLGTWHDDGNCPKWVSDRRDEANEGQQKLLVFSTSFLRHAKDTKTTRYDCVPGAQIGHIGNHIDNDATILPNADVIVVAAGQNMGGDVLDVMKEKVKSQGEVLVRALKPYTETPGEKKVYVVDPVIGELDGDDGDDDDDENRFLRAEMKRMATKAGGKFVPMDTLQLQEGDMDDDIHLSESGVRRFLTAVRDFVRNDIGRDVFGDIATSSQAYAGQRLRHYKVGCPKCTFVHAGSTCPKTTSDSGDNEADNDDDDETKTASNAASETLQQQPSSDDASNDDASKDDASTRSRKKKKRKTTQKQQQQASDMEESSPELPTARQQLAAPQADAATPTLDLSTSFAAALMATPSGRTLPADPRTRSSSSKRGSDDDQTRSESQKRAKTETELELAIKRNREMLIEGGMNAEKQAAMWKNLKGVQLLNRQKSMIEKVCTIPNNKLASMKKGGRK